MALEQNPLSALGTSHVKQGIAANRVSRVSRCKRESKISSLLLAHPASAEREMAATASSR